MRCLVTKPIEKQFENLNSATVQKLTQTIIMSWKRSVFSLLITGRCLKELKSILSRQDFLTILETKLSISEMHAHRLIRLHDFFGDNPNEEILSAKPSVLYQISSSIDTSEQAVKNLKQLFKGKKINELTIKEVKSVTQKKSVTIKTADPLHREIISLMNEIIDETNNIKKSVKRTPLKQEVSNVKNSVREAMECLKELNSII